MTGFFNLSWNGFNLRVDAQITELDLAALLKDTLPGFGDSTVERTRDCSGYKWRVKFVEGGDKEQMEVGNSELLGESVTISSSQIRRGGVRFYPITGDFLRTHHDKPQVSVRINDIPATCDDCTFEWSAAATPIVDTINAGTFF